MSFTCLIGIISDSETLELLAASLSFKDLLPYLTFTWSCFIYGTVSLLLICDYCKCSRLSNNIFFLLGESYPLFPSELPHISFNFLVELFYLILCDCQTMLFHYYKPFHFLLFHTLPLHCVGCHTFLSPLSEWNCLTFLCECHANILVLITSTWTLYFVSIWVITDPYFFFSCVDCHTSPKWKFHFSIFCLWFIYKYNFDVSTL